MKLAYFDIRDGYRPDADRILEFARPKPDDFVEYYRHVIRALRAS